MSRLVMGILLIGLSIAVAEALAKNPYQEPLKPKSFTAHAVVLQPRTLGTTVIRKKSTIAVEIRVQLEDFLPRDMEPTLLIDGVPIEGASRIVGVQDRITTVGFLVEKPELLKEGAALSVRMGDEPRTLAKVPGILRQQDIQPLVPDSAKDGELPSLSEWLRQGKSR